MNSFPEQLKAYTNQVEAYLDTCFTGKYDYQVLTDAMRYSLLAGGKRLRPVLCLAFCKAVGGDPDRILPGACAIEMVHTYSLIHDDLPCMDNDDYRRGKLTCHKVYGYDMAMLAGDGLLTAAFHQLAVMDADAEKRIRCVEILSAGAGEHGMVAGQVLDLLGEHQHLGEEALRSIHLRKTGALIAAACEMGVILGGGTEQQLAAARAFALSLGMAFQIRDDMLDEIGTQEELGKPIGSDAGNEKSTFVTLLGLEACQRLVEQETDEALRALDHGGFEQVEFLTELSKMLTGRTK